MHKAGSICTQVGHIAWKGASLRLASRFSSGSLALRGELPVVAMVGKEIGGEDVWQVKKDLRKSVGKALKSMTDVQQKEESAKIIKRVLGMPAFQTGRRVGVFLSVPKLNEVDTGQLVGALLTDAKKRCYAPSVQDKQSNMAFYHVDTLDCVKSMPPYGIREPQETYQDGSPREEVMKMDQPLDLLIMTGQAFDRKGGRLGRGGGYYDKFIARCFERAEQQKWERPLLVALAFEEQVVSGEVPTTSNDQPMDILITPDATQAVSEKGQIATTCNGKE